MTESIDPAIPVDTNESVEWAGRPRVTTILPAVVIGVLLLVSGIVVSVTTENPFFLAVVPLGVAIPLWKYFALQGVQYVITDEALYVKRGVLTRSVTQANLETVQNSSFGQDITGSIFGYGSVTFEIAGGDDLSFRAIEDPRAIRALVDRTASNNDGLGGNDRRESGIPGDLTQWQQIRDEIRAIRSSLEDSRLGTARE
ncbi:PH domain-containing protein [Halorubrum trueperi]|uniref:PH domain-containing protein n=1 Tax=Halorubrum trueperi TaxID=2004704 RepID=A0ABD5UML1_9EURY